MLLEIKKEKNKFVLLNPPKQAGTHFFIDMDTGKIIPGKESKYVPAPNIHKTVQQLANKYPGNEFLKLSLQLTPENYSTTGELSNDQLLNDAYFDKYGI